MLTGNILLAASRHRATGERATAPSHVQIARSDHAASVPGARATSPCRGQFSPLDRAARPRPMWLFGWPRVVGRHITRAVAAGRFVAQHCA
jgi:hypothetical protein